MKIVTVEVLPVRDGETVSATIIQEQRRSETWNRVKAWDVMSGTPEAKRRIMLEDNERVVVEGRADTTLVYDPEQKAAIPMPSDPVKAAAKVDEDAKIAEENTRRENEERVKREAAEAAARTSAPRTNIGNPAPTPPVVTPMPTASASASNAPPVKPATPVVNPGPTKTGSAASKGPGGTPSGQGAKASNE